MHRAGNDRCQSRDIEGHELREPLKIHFGGKRILFVSDRRQIEAALSSNKADLSSLSENKNILLSAQKQLLELPSILAIL